MIYQLLNQLNNLYESLSTSSEDTGIDSSEALVYIQEGFEYMTEAIVTKSSPRFSWEPVSSVNGQQQTAWQIIVSDDIDKIETGKGNTWNSGKQRGDETYGIKWKNIRLQSFLNAGS